MTTRAVAGAGAPRRSFNHLFSFGQAPHAEAPKDDESPKKDDEKEEEGAKTEDEAEGDQKDCPECDGSGEDEDGDDCQACDGTGKVEGKKAKKSKKAKAEEDDEMEEEKGDDKDAARLARSARRFERARCAAIFGATAAAQRPDLAAHLAFNTKMGAKAAIGLLQTAAQGGPTQTRATRPRVNLGDGGGAAGGRPDPNSSAGKAAAIMAAAAKARGETPKA